MFLTRLMQVDIPEFKMFPLVYEILKAMIEYSRKMNVRTIFRILTLN